jgi:hypothetical protein
MMRPIVDQVAALAQASQVSQPIVAWIVIEMGSGENDPGLPYASNFFNVGPARWATAMIAPSPTGSVVPVTVRQAANDFAMRAPTALTHAAGAFESHMPAQLRPVDRVEPAHIRAV